jgi:hypothetical protein
LERETPKLYQPFFAEIDLNSNHAAARVIVMAQNRKEYVPYLASLADSYKHDGSCYEDWPRFASMEEQQAVLDIKAAGWENPVGIDSILSNSVHVSPFSGPILCSWCANMLISQGIQDLVAHILSDHRVLFESLFTCPTCLSPSLVTWKEWRGHWNRYHAAGTALCIVLNEISCHTRYSWGIALMAVVSMTDTLELDLRQYLDEKDARERFTAYGGFTARTTKIKEAKTVLRRVQDTLLPPELRNFQEEKPRKQMNPGFRPIPGPSGMASMSRAQSRAGTPSTYATKAMQPPGQLEQGRPPSIRGEPYNPETQPISPMLRPTPTYAAPSYQPGPVGTGQGMLETPHFGLQENYVQDELEAEMESMRSSPAFTPVMSRKRNRRKAAGDLLDPRDSDPSDAEPADENTLDRDGSGDERMMDHF